MLRLVPTSKALFVLDALLGALTNKSAFKRRLAYVALVVSVYLFYSTLFHHVKARPTTLAPSKLELEDAAAAAYSPTPPTPDQQRDYVKLVELIDSKSSAYPATIFQERALASDSSRVVGVTAVVLHWKRRKGLQLVLQHITRYPFIREVIIWNNMGGVDLVAEVREAVGAVGTVADTGS